MARDSAWERLNQSDVKRKRFYEDQVKVREKFTEKSYGDLVSESFERGALLARTQITKEEEEDSSSLGASFIGLLVALIVGVIAISVVTSVIDDFSLMSDGSDLNSLGGISLGGISSTTNTIMTFIPFILVLGLIASLFGMFNGSSSRLF